MCNHYRQISDDPEDMQWIMEQEVGLAPPEYLKGFEVWPKGRAPVVVMLEGRPTLTQMRWGVAVEIHGKTNYVTNARNDKLLKGYPWRYSASERRCLIPARGYFEPGLGPPGRRGELYFTLKDRPRFFIAGLWDTDGDESGTRAFTMVTTDPNPYAARFHDRMPAALTDAEAKRWLGEKKLPDDELLSLIRGAPETIMQHIEIEAKPRESKKITKKDIASGELELGL